MCYSLFSKTYNQLVLFFLLPPDYEYMWYIIDNKVTLLVYHKATAWYNNDAKSHGFL